MARLLTAASSEYLSAANALGLSPPYSVAVLFKPASVPGGGRRPIFCVQEDETNKYHILAIKSTGALMFEHENGAGYGLAQTASTMSAGNWYWCCASADSTTSRTVWLDGASEDTDTNSVTNPSFDIARVGRIALSAATSLYLDGSVEFLALWSAGMTTAQAAAIGAGVHPLAVKPTNLIDYFDLTRNLVGRKGNTLSATGTSIVANSGKVYFFPSKHRFIEGVATAASEALTGNAATTAVGSVGVTVTKALTGEAATTAVDSVTAGITEALSGEAATGAVGSVGATVTKALTGEAATGAVGTVGTGTVDAITGEAATTAVGSVGVSVTKALTGEAATTAVGSVGATVTKALTGEAATGAVGTVSPSVGAVVALTGEEATTAVGSVGVSVTKAITGVEATGAVGSITVSSGLTGRRRKTRSRRVNLWEVASPEPVQNDPALLNKLLKEMAQAQILAKKYLPERNPRYEVEMESLRTNSKALTRLINTYRKEMDEREKEDELLLL